jgi:membrane-associated protease RseP (regulator of RpoE activity)
MNFALFAQTTVLFILIVIIHELGHLLVAKFYKFKVLEFAIGMGPTLFSKKYGDTNYMFKLYPLGGHIRLDFKKVDDMSTKQIAQWMVGVMAGPMANIVTGILVYQISPWFTLLSLFTGLVNLIPIPPQDGFLLMAGAYHLGKRFKNRK